MNPPPVIGAGLPPDYSHAETRLRESSGDDDNAGIENHIGRAELSSAWQINQAHTLGVTLRHSLRREARGISVTPLMK